jgi:cytoskeletal protein CcmA (bactofilin family)
MAKLNEHYGETYGEKAMKKAIVYSCLLLVVVAAAAIFFVPTVSLQTQDIPAGASAPSPEHKDLLRADETVEVISEGATGDVVVAGANVTIAGDVQGYVMAAGAYVTVNAPVGNDLWAAGANVNVNAPIADNAMLAGSVVTISRDASIGGSARIGASTANVFGRVTQDLKIAATNASIGSDVGGNVDVRAERLTIEPGAVIHGKLTVHSPNEPVISPDALVLGGIDHRPSDRNRRSALLSWLGGWLLRFVWLTVLGLVAIWLSPLWVNRVAETLKRDTGRSFLTGLVAVVAVPVICILLLVTVIGLPLAFVLGGASVVFLMLAAVFVSFLLGGWATGQLKRWTGSNLAKVVLGSLIVSIVIMLPWVGWLAKLLVVLFGVGAFLIERRDLFRQMRAQGLA